MIQYIFFNVSFSCVFNAFSQVLAVVFSKINLFFTPQQHFWILKMTQTNEKVTKSWFHFMPYKVKFVYPSSSLVLSHCVHTQPSAHGGVGGSYPPTDTWNQHRPEHTALWSPNMEVNTPTYTQNTYLNTV